MIAALYRRNQTTLIGCILAVCAGIFALAAAGPSAAQVQRIAAVVNTDVVSVLDVNDRLKTVLFTSGLADTQEQRQQLMPRIVRQLIDETLQRQEAKRLSITVTERELADAIRALEQRNRIEAGGFDGFVRRNGLSRGAVESQVRAQLLWQKVVSRRLVPSVEIGEEEVDQVLERIVAARGQIESRVGEIVLALDDPRARAETEALAQRLVTQIRGGADFASVAAQFSQSASAAVGGDLGWIQAGQLDPVLDRAVAAMAPGQLSAPIVLDSSIHILLLISRRQIAGGAVEPAAAPPPVAVAAVKPGEYLLRQLLLPLPQGATADQTRLATERAAAATRGIESCNAFARMAQELGTPQTPEPARLRAEDVAADLRRVLEELPTNRASAPIARPGGVQVVFKCGAEAPQQVAQAQQPPAGGPPGRREISDQLARERLDMLARRYMRDLQRVATIEVRL